MLSLLFMKVWCLCLVCRTLKWVRKYWSARGITGHKSAGPLRACVNIADCCDPSSAGTLTCIKSLKMFYESTFCHRIRTIHNSGSILSVW
jgi:hypothetical protein